MIGYAITGGPPDNWNELGIRFNGQERTEVYEANAEEGWIRVYKTFEGRPVIEDGEWVKEVLYGNVEIYVKGEE